LDLPIRNFATNEDSLEKLKEILDKLTKPENYIKVLVEMIPQGKDNILRLVGNYKHN
jgi:hypothetical protein